MFPASAADTFCNKLSLNFGNVRFILSVCFCGVTLSVLLRTFEHLGSDFIGFEFSLTSQIGWSGKWLRLAPVTGVIESHTQV